MTTGFTGNSNERLAALLVADWGEELTAEERAELEAMVREHAGEAFELERAAAAACVAFAEASPPPEAPPAALMARVRAQAEAHFAGRPTGQVPGGASSTGSTPASSSTPSQVGPTSREASGGSGSANELGAPTRLVPRSTPGTGWWIALAASLALAVAGWLPQLLPSPPPEPVVVEVPVEVPVEPPPPLKPEERLAEIRTDQPDARAIPWTTTEDPWVSESVDGQVVWSNDLQEGYMTFAGLPKNDPSKNRYQLWIFDGTRDDRYPVDGGVFDVVDAAHETVVPIVAKLPIGQPKLFAVTLEGPDGVVVSDREHILVVAQVN